ncbi:MAG: SAM-dependent DNA methyltransferase, partial [Nitrososphaerota archaeon]|nr:SAM-dependent DNA methyltransferase [Nitrososphaerota archaeon]
MTEFEFEERSSSLVRLVRNDPDSLLQILLAVSTGQSRKRIVGSPAYPIASPTTDLPKRVALFKEMLLMDSRSAPFIMAKMFAAAVDLDWRKTYGQFFTPYDVARTVIHDLAIREGDMVLDAGSGTGSFAVAILDQFGSSTRTQYLGVEMDPILTLCGAIALEYLQAPPNWKILYRNFLRVDENVLFRIGFRSVDAIVANPPFIRSNRIADRQTFLPKLEQRFGFSVPGYSGSHSFFLAHATTLIDPNGKIGFLFPIGMSEVGYGAKLLSHISTRFEYSQKQVSPELKLFVFRKGQNHNTIHSSHKPDELLLESFADVHRGISTGANSFFVLSENEAKALRLPSKNL